MEHDDIPATQDIQPDPAEEKTTPVPQTDTPSPSGEEEGQVTKEMPVPPAPHSFPGFKDRITRTVDRYKERWISFTLLTLAFFIVPIIMSLIIGIFAMTSVLATLASGSTVLLYLLGAGTAVAAVILLFFQTYITTGLAATAAFKTPFITSIRTAKHYVIPAIIAYLLISFITSVAGVLLIIPGIVLLLRFMLYMQVILNERRKGLDALLRSRDLIYGKTRTLFLEILLGSMALSLISGIFVIIVGGLLGFIPGLGGEQGLGNGIASTIATLIMMPIGIVYLQIFYEDAVRREKVDWAPNMKLEKRYKVMAIMGAVLLIIPLFALPPTLKNILSLVGMTSESETMPIEDATQTEIENADEGPSEEAQRDLERHRHMTELRIHLASYLNRNHALPSSLDELVPTILEVLPTDPLSGEVYTYEYLESDYLIRFTLEEGAFSLPSGEHTLTRDGFNKQPDVDREIIVPTTSAATIGDAETQIEIDPIATTDTDTDVGADTDNDGLADDFEISIGTDPNSTDSDRDGIEDGIEFRTLKTDPAIADTDGDGFSDGEELIGGFDPLVAGGTLPDLDNDGLANLYEELHGLDGGDPDMDDDGLSDGDELRVFGTDMQVADTDGDGFDDVAELSGGFEPLGDGDLTLFRRDEIRAAIVQYGLHPPTNIEF